MAKGRTQDIDNKRANKGRKGDETEDKGIGALVAQGISEEGQESIERVVEDVKSYFDKGREYVSENPKEAAGLAVAAGFAAWALLGTKPGRMLFEAGSAVAVPQITKFFTRSMSGTISNLASNETNH